MDIRIRKRYYERSDKSRSPASFTARQPKGVGTTVHATIRLDPVLKKHKDLRKGVLKHETDEIRAWGKGKTSTHRLANRKEPQVTRKLGGTKGFWGEIDRRNRR